MTSFKLLRAVRTDTGFHTTWVRTDTGFHTTWLMVS